MTPTYKVTLLLSIVFWPLAPELTRMYRKLLTISHSKDAMNYPLLYRII